MQTVDSLLDVPCFKCLASGEVSLFNCLPEKCEKLDNWLSLTNLKLHRGQVYTRDISP